MNDSDQTKHLYPKWQRLWQERLSLYLDQKKSIRETSNPERDALNVQSGEPKAHMEPPSIIWPTIVCLKSKIVPSILMRIIGDLLQFASPILLG